MAHGFYRHFPRDTETLRAQHGPIQSCSPGGPAASGGKACSLRNRPQGSGRAVDTIVCGGHVSWNASANSWDCPCHGGRFDTTGSIHDEPAPQPLERFELERISTHRVMHGSGDGRSRFDVGSKSVEACTS